MAKAPKNAITPTRSENFPEWYQQVIKGADLAETSETNFREYKRFSLTTKKNCKRIPTNQYKNNTKNTQE